MPELDEIVSTAIDALVGSYRKYLSNATAEPERHARDILASPFRSQGANTEALSHHRIINARTGKIAECLEACAYQLASHHQGVTVTLQEGAVAFEMQRENDRIILMIQSRLASENGGSQAKENTRTLLAQAGEGTKLVRAYAAERGTPSAWRTRNGIQHIRGPMLFHWLSGDPQCFDRLVAMITPRVSTREIRLAEAQLRLALELALIRCEADESDPAEYERARYDLEQELGPCAPVLVTRVEPVVSAASIFDLFDQANEMDAAEERWREAEPVT